MHDMIAHRIKTYIEKRYLPFEQFFLVYQPQVHLPTRQIIGAEALIRWNSPEFGLVSPVFFIPYIESSDLIHELGKWVIRKTLMTMKKWREKTGKIIPVSINVSPKQLNNNGYCKIDDFILNELEKHSINEKFFEIEITETANIPDFLSSQEILKNLSQNNISIALDDLGSSYSSFEKILNLPISTLKIDRGVTKHLMTNPKATNLIESILCLGNKIESRIIIEGVEKEEELKIIHDLGAEIVQGYFFFPPVTESEMEKILANNSLLLAKP